MKATVEIYLLLKQELERAEIVVISSKGFGSTWLLMGCGFKVVKSVQQRKHAWSFLSELEPSVSGPFFNLSQSAFAQKNGLTAPKGSTVEKLGLGNFRFILPNRQVVEVKGLDLQKRIVGQISVVDPGHPHKPVVSAVQGKIAVIDPEPPHRPINVSFNLSSGKNYLNVNGELYELRKIPPANYVMIDDDIVWLPIIIQFKK